MRHYVKRKFYEKFIVLEYPKKRKEILAYSKEYLSSVFVETGTFFGDTTDFLKDHFLQLYTIELQEDLFKKARQRFAGIDKIKVLQGDSSVVLKDIVDEISGNTLFWLDGHYSSSFFVGDEFIATAKGIKECPIIEELEIILKNGLNKNVILIDDARYFKGKNDYPTIKELKLLLQRLGIKKTQIKIKNDIIRIVPID
jgi:hypothetical protein